MKVFVASIFLVFVVFCVSEGLANPECKCVPEQCCEEEADQDECGECPQGAVSCAKTNTRDCRDVNAMDPADLEELLESLLNERTGRSARSAESEDKENLMKKIQELVEERKY